MRTSMVRRWLALSALSACTFDTTPAARAARQDAATRVEATAAADATLPLMAACPHGDGLYCEQRFEADAHVLYRCAAGRLSLASVCAIACDPVADGGEDRCRLPTASGGDAGAAVTGSAGGTRAGEPGAAAGAGGQRAGAGGHLQPPAAGGAGGAALAGEGGRPQLPAAGGAALAGAGGRAGDGGRAAAMGGAGARATQPWSCPVGDGLYCGGQGLGGVRDVLYRCSDGELAPVAQCQLGCQTFGAGGQDDCRTPATPGVPSPPPGQFPPGPGQPAPPP